MVCWDEPCLLLMVTCSHEYSHNEHSSTDDACIRVIHSHKSIGELRFNGDTGLEIVYTQGVVWWRASRVSLLGPGRTG